MSRFFFVYTFIFILSACSTAEAYDTENIFLVVIDGIRADEGFSYPVEPGEEHPYIPWLWSLQSAGTLYTDIMCNTFTSTFTGHAQMLNGCPIIMPNYSYIDDYRNIRVDDPTIFEYYRKALGCPPEQARAIVGKSTVGRLDYSNHPVYGPEYKGLFEYGFPDGTDPAVWSALQVIMEEDKPPLVMVNLKEVDSIGHKGIFDNYIAKIRYADSISVELWSRIQSDPAYADRTTMIVTTDHGRHSDYPLCHGFRHHSGSCFGCRQTFVLALGPDTPEGLIVRDPRDQQDIAATMAELLNIDAPLVRSDPLWEMLGKSGPIAKIRPQHPMIIADGGIVRRVFVESDGSAHRLITEVTSDQGVSWHGRREIFSSPWQIEAPSVTPYASGLLVTWVALIQGSWTLFSTEIYEESGTAGAVSRVSRSRPESPVESSTVNSPFRVIADPVYLAARDGSRFIINAFNKDEILCHSFQQNPAAMGGSFGGSAGFELGNRAIDAGENSGQDQGGRWETLLITGQSCWFIKDLDAAVTDNGEIVVAYSDLSAYREIPKGIERNFEIHFLIGRNGGLDWDEPIRVTADSCFSIHPAVCAGPEGEARVVWADNRSGRFQLYFVDIDIASGTFSDLSQVRESPQGDWQPDLVYDEISDTYLFTWTGFDGDDGNIYCGRRKTGVGIKVHRVESTGGFSQRSRISIDPATHNAWIAWEEISSGGEWGSRLSKLPSGW